MIVASAEAFNCQYEKMENIFQKSVYQLTQETQERYIQLFFGDESEEMQLLDNKDYEGPQMMM